MFKKKSEEQNATSGRRQESPRPPDSQRNSSSRPRPPNVLNVTPSVGAEANTIGAARRVTPVILGKANHSDAGDTYRASSSERRRPEKQIVVAPLHSAPLHILDEHSHFASTLSRRMERYMNDVGDDCTNDKGLINRFGEARSARSSVLSSSTAETTPRELDALRVPVSDSAPWPSPKASRRDTRMGERQGNSDANSLLLGSGAAVLGHPIPSGLNAPSSSPHPHADRYADDDDKESASAASASSSYTRPRTVPSNPRGGGMAENSPRRSHQPQLMSPASAAMMMGEQRRSHRRGSRDMPKQAYMSHSPRRGLANRGRGEESCLEALAAIERRVDY
mmetsp:Transcript_72501/g.136968  ORF Transcript_72501/g.136968 Transcript_72501/m.136968 type:complete len:336 (-) Transcript_72501:115-1122(-)